MKFTIDMDRMTMAEMRAVIAMVKRCTADDISYMTREVLEAYFQGYFGVKGQADGL